MKVITEMHLCALNLKKKVCDLFSRKKTAEKSNMPKDCIKADNVM
jgi:hypothetical protein